MMQTGVYISTKATNMRPRALLFGASIYLSCLPTVFCQSIAKVGPSAVIVDELCPVQGGGYVAVRKESPGPRITRLDAEFNPIWSKRLTGAPPSWQHVAVSPEGGTVLVRWRGLDLDVAPPSDSLDILFDMVRVSHDGEVLWAKQGRLRRPNSSVASTVEPKRVSVNGLGEVTLVFDRVNPWSPCTIMRFSAYGEALWMVELPDYFDWAYTQLAEDASGCYVMGTRNGSSTFKVAFINESGPPGWNMDTDLPGYSFYYPKMAIASDGGLYLTSEHLGNIVVMKAGSGSMEWIRLNAPVPPNPPGVLYTASGLVAVDDGFALVTGTTNRGLLRLHADDGVVVATQRTALSTQGEITRSHQLFNLWNSAGTLTIGGSARDHNNTFNLNADYPMFLSMSAVDPLPCIGSSTTTSEMAIPLSQATTTQLPEIPLMPIMPTVDIQGELVDEVLWATSPLCSGVGVDEISDVRSLLAPNPVLSFGTVRLPEGMVDEAEINDHLGRLVARVDLIDGSCTVGVAPGAYVIVAIDRGNGLPKAMPLVVE